MIGQTYRLENRWWIRYQTEIPYSPSIVDNRCTWITTAPPSWPLKDGEWVEFEIKKVKAGSTKAGPVYNKFAVIKNPYENKN